MEKTLKDLVEEIYSEKKLPKEIFDIVDKEMKKRR